SLSLHDALPISRGTLLLSDAETGEDVVQKILDIHPANQGIQPADAAPQVFCRNLGPRWPRSYFIASRFHRGNGVCDGLSLAFAGNDAGRGRAPGKLFRDPADEIADAGPRLAGNREQPHLGIRSQIGLSTRAAI